MNQRQAGTWADELPLGKPHRPRYSLRIPACFLACFFVMGAIAVLWHWSEDGRVPELSTAKAFPEPLRQFPFSGPVDYHYSNSSAYTRYMFAGRAACRRFERFCEAHGMKLETDFSGECTEHLNRRLIDSYGVDPKVFGMRSADRTRFTLGRLAERWYVQLYYDKETERLLIIAEQSHRGDR